jgi:hypothetical protein
MEQTRKTQTRATDIESLDLPIEKSISNVEGKSSGRGKRGRQGGVGTIVDIIIK